MESFNNSSECELTMLQNVPFNIRSSPNKCNLSFSFNFDGDGMHSEISTDSEPAGLQIDVSEIDNYQRPRKRSRLEIEDEPTFSGMLAEGNGRELNEKSAITNLTVAVDVSEIDNYQRPRKRSTLKIEDAPALSEMLAEEIERKLDEKAAITNLTVANVKNLIRHVITNEHVMVMFQNHLHNTPEKTIFEPKLTRAKAKELAMAQPDIPWSMTPVKKSAPSDVQALIENDLFEDSSDEEYNPEQDQQSDDEIENIITSDFDSQPSTPADGVGSYPPTDQNITVDINFDSDGIFKIPDIPHVLTEEESIGHRTRSKLSLSETPIEQIEEQFVPPDATEDMYDTETYIDDPVWGGFLRELKGPPPKEHNVDDDPEADPEYNILEDHETELVDKEELRSDKGVNVTKKELNNLFLEIYEYENMFDEAETEQRKKKKSPDNSIGSIKNTSMNNSMVDLLPALAEPELPKLVTYEHRRLIEIQFQQHVQLMTQHFALTYLHPDLHSQSKTCKENLNSINILETGENSSFAVSNLPEALNFINEWETTLEDTKVREHYFDMMNRDFEIGEKMTKRKVKYYGEFHPTLSKLMMESKAFMYPELLPHVPFTMPSIKKSHSKSEDYLLALGLDQFLPYLQSMERKFSSRKSILHDTVAMICQYLMPARKPQQLFSWLTSQRAVGARPNPIQAYFNTGFVPPRIHCIPSHYDIKCPKDQPREYLPKVWKTYLDNQDKCKEIESLEETVRDLTEPNFYMPVNTVFQSPIINMMPNMPHLDQTPRSNSFVNSNEEELDSSIENPLRATNLPQLRKTTPRLAKMRSAQNMKLMTQVSGPKSLSGCSSTRSRGKDDSLKDSSLSCGSLNGDNEDEIAELMLASTTIKKDTANRKKAKQARELENIKRLREAENELGKEERATKFAASYIQKLHLTLESSNPETLRAVIKLWLEYSEKLEKAQTQEEQDKLAINLYKDINETLREYPDMCTDFLLFLTPQQAAMIGESSQHTMLWKMSEFINVSQIYFAKQPSRIARIIQALTQLATDTNVTMQSMITAMDSVLKGHPVVMDEFLKIFPLGKPPESLFSPNLFENLTCPVGPYDKHKVYTDDSPELYENIELSTPANQEDPYGGDNCKCDCHDAGDANVKTGNIDHCRSCGVRYLNGKIYLQTSEGLRPAKVTFEGDEDEKLENISRISMKTTERFLPATSTGRRRKSSKNDADELNQKPCSSKISPIKDSEDNEKTGSKTKRGAKSPPKSVDQRRMSKSSEAGSSSTVFSPSVSIENPSPIKSKREKRAERREAKSESKNLNSDANKFQEIASPILCDQEELVIKGNLNEMSLDTHKINESSDSELNQSSELMEISGISDSDTTGESEDVKYFRPWTRQEDMLLLQNIQKDYSEETFTIVSEMLDNRTIQQVKERFDTLLTMLQKMV